jgi:hypothetical protein
MKVISVAAEFTEYPGLRHSSISQDSGEDFYHSILNPAFAEAYRSQSPLCIELDLVDGYAPSFLDEAFGNLVYDFGEEAVLRLLHITSDEEPQWIPMLTKQTYPQWEKRRRLGETPKVTAKHPAWFRLEDGTLKQAIWEQPRA